MKKLSDNHTTVILMLSDGTHRYSHWNKEATSKECWDFVRETIEWLRPTLYVNEMFLASGVQSLRYTRNEVIELSEKKS